MNLLKWITYNPFEISGTKSNQRLLQAREIISGWYFLRQMTMFIWVIDCKKNHDPISFSSRYILIFPNFLLRILKSRAIFPLQLRLKHENRNHFLQSLKQKGVWEFWLIQMIDHIVGCSYTKFEAWRTVCLLCKTQALFSLNFENFMRNRARSRAIARDFS